MNQFFLSSSLFATLVLSATLSTAAEPEKRSLADLSFMVGSWRQITDKAEVEEHWLPAKGDVMLGLGRTVRSSGKPAAFEFLRIAPSKAGLSYFASPQGRSATEFPLIELAKDKVVFENPGHDFPQRISYWLEGGKLKARVEGTVKGQKQSEEWTWEKTP